MGLVLVIVLSVFAGSDCALAFPDKDEQKFRLAMSELRRVFEETERSPPCEAHQRMREAFLRLDPPASCKKAKIYFDYINLAQRKMEENCRELTHWIEPLLRDPSFCHLPQKEARLTAYREHLGSLKMKGQEESMGRDDAEDNVLREAGLWAIPSEFDVYEKKGEYSLVDCKIAATAGLQIRKIQLTRFSQHYSRVDGVLDYLCTEESRDRDEYLDFLRYGDDPSTTPNR